MMDYTSSNWCNLEWTPWIPFTNNSLFRLLPDTPGVYRVRAINGEELFYIGQTGRSLRGRLNDLRRNAMKATMPYNDPHTAAPSLWAWRDAEGIEFECSAAPIILTTNSKDARKLQVGLEHCLLWQYRLAYGSSTRCNHGRFHPRYLKSKDRKDKFQGRRLDDHELSNCAGGPSLPPLQLIAGPLDQTWMGLLWSIPGILNTFNVRTITPLPGIYKIFDAETSILLYVGESKNLRNRLTTHIRKKWGCIDPRFSYVQLPNDTPTYQRHEIENDLIGSFYSLERQLPKFQLINHRQENLTRSSL